MVATSIYKVYCGWNISLNAFYFLPFSVCHVGTKFRDLLIIYMDILITEESYTVNNILITWTIDDSTSDNTKKTLVIYAA